jgi:hypothetical protein
MKRTVLVLPWYLALSIMLPAQGPAVDEAAVVPQAVRPGGGWEVSGDPYDHDKIGELKKKIAQGEFKNITSVVVIKDGKLLVEEYFNGRTRRRSQHPLRGKTFTSALMGAAIRDGYIKNLDQTLGNSTTLILRQFSPKKSAVTLKNLMTMSRLPRDQITTPPRPGMRRTCTDAELGEVPRSSHGRCHENGKQWDYFTAGVVLVGDILDRPSPAD